MFKIVFIVYFLIICFLNLIKIFYFIQLEQYKVNSIFKNIVAYIAKFGIKDIILFLIVFLIYWVVDKNNNFINLVISTIIFSSFIVFDFKEYKSNKLVYTKRIIRMLFVYVILCLILLCLLVCYSSTFIMNSCFIFLYIIDLILTFVSLFLLYPIEKLIALNYIKKAKAKLKLYTKIKKIGITGSYGKTSVKEIITTILNEKYSVLTTPKSFNTPLGITKTINNNLNNLHDVFVCEMGAKKKGEIDQLCKLVDVNMGIVTAVGRQHVQTFKNLENIYNTKKELPDYLSGKMCVFNLMNAYTYQMYREYDGLKSGVFLLDHKAVSNKVKNKLLKQRYINLNYPKNIVKFYNLCLYPTNNNYYAKNIKSNKDGCFFDIYYNGKFLLNLNTEIVGRHNIINILLSVALSFYLGLSCKDILSGVSKLKPIKARFEKFISSKGAIIINNGYNSNIDSVEEILKSLTYFNRKKIIVITPGIIETGNDPEYNKNFGEKLSKYATDICIVKEKNKNAILKGLINSNFDKSKITFVKSFNDAQYIINNCGDDSVILIENDLPDNYK